MLAMPAQWQAFLDRKTEKGAMTRRERDDLLHFIEERKYEPVVRAIQSGQGLSDPVMWEINKSGTGRKRTVFTFPREENYVLKLIAHLLSAYDYLFPDNLYSFRENIGIKKAVARTIRFAGRGTLYSYKADIHDYFNSIDTESILVLTEKYLSAEPGLTALIRSILTNPFAIQNGRRIKARKGVMAGVPIAGFLADLYLREMDLWFQERGAMYARYSDDIIVFSRDRDEIAAFEEQIKRFLAEKGLEINPQKERRTVPGESWEFLGFSVSGGSVDVSAATLRKLKAKLRRKARALYRWKIRKNASDERTERAYIRFLNRKFYENHDPGEITWARWYFPVITTDQSLRQIDDYAVSCIRYLRSGRYGKQNFSLRYEEIRQMGFQSLVNRYWRFRSGRYVPENESRRPSFVTR